MKKSFVLHDETVNTYGFMMLTSGCDLTEFRKNPVMLLNHNDWQLPIGRWENIRIEGTRILGDPVFDMKDTREQGGAEIARKVENDFLRMASIGAWAPDEIDDDPARWISGQTRPTVTRWKAREASIVTIGSNHNALAFYDSKTGEKIDLKDVETVIKLIDVKKGIYSNSNLEFADFQSSPWDKIDKQGNLRKLKEKYPTLYVAKFEEKFGCKPNLN